MGLGAERVRLHAPMTDAEGTRAGGSDDGRATVAGDQDGTALAATFIGRSLGDFHVIREVGRGSMGIVFEAEQRELKRKVALKILPPSLSVTETVIKRFLREAQSVAKLSHDNIVQIFDIGDQDGVFFYAMQFVEGQSLDKVLRQRKLTPKECATIIAAAARAVFFANENGIVHRDIKPGNIILTYKDKPVLTDFGLARPEKGATLTESGALVGTPIYMSPEQVRGDRAQIDRRTDIYSLGVTLYEMLAGRTPYEGTSTQEILRKIEHDEPKPLRSVAPDVPKPLAVITHKAIEKESGRRYQTAIEFALDLERYLAGEQIQARPTKFATRIMRRARRHKIIVGLGIALLLAVGVTLISMNRSRAAKRNEEAERGKAQQANVVRITTEGADLYRNDKWLPALDKFAELTRSSTAPAELADAHVWRGKCFYRLENLEQALAEFDAAITLDPKQPSARQWSAIARCRYGNAREQDAAIADLRAQPQGDTSDAECFREATRICVELATDAPTQRRREEMIAIAQARVTELLKNQDDDEAWVLQGLLYEIEGATDPTMTKMARACWEKAKQINKQNPRAWALLNRGDEAAATQPVANGSDAPRSAVGVPTWWGALAAQGVGWASRKLPASTDLWNGAVGALGFGSRGAGGAGGAPPVGAPEIAAVEQLMAEANKSWDEGDRATAAALYRRVLEKDDSIVEVHNRLAETALDLGNVTEALSHVDSARRLAPTNLRTLTVAMRAYTVVGDRAKMQEVVAIVVHEHPAVLNVPTIREVLAPFLPELTQPAQPGQLPPDDTKPAGGG